MSFQKEFERRLRRVAGQTDDTVDVSYEVEKEDGYGGGCDTCGYGRDDGRAYVTVYAGYGHTREFEDLGEMMREMDAVPDEENSEKTSE